MLVELRGGQEKGQVFPSLCPAHSQRPADVHLGQREMALLDQGFGVCQPDPHLNPSLSHPTYSQPLPLQTWTPLETTRSFP